MYRFSNAVPTETFPVEFTANMNGLTIVAEFISDEEEAFLQGFMNREFGKSNHRIFVIHFHEADHTEVRVFS